ncbi:MAG: hypothetical protein NTU79_00400 [Planctomycetota bacterium]|nr:hypothetical protein [Planctomycetota bacterium]
MNYAFKASLDTNNPTIRGNEWRKISSHKAVAYILSPAIKKSEAEQISATALQLVAELLQAGGTAAKSESAGLAHGRDQRLDLSKQYARAKASGDFHTASATLYRAWVQRAIHDPDTNSLYSVGMHLLGHRDVDLNDDRDVSEAVKWIDLMIHCLWEIGATHSEFIEQLLGLDNQSKLEHYWGDGLSRRRATVARLLKKVSTPKAKPRNAKGARPKITPLFLPGDCLLYQRTNGRYVPLLFWDVERCNGVHYLLAVPHLSRVEDPELIKRYFSRPETLSDVELSQFFTSKKRFKTIAVKDKVMKAHRASFFRYAQRSFPPSDWKNSMIGNPAETLDSFEQLLNGSGSRSVSQLEIEQMKSNGLF